MKLIVGLGNPEPQYALTRHNAGFWVVDRLATEYGVTFELSNNLQAYVGKISVNSQPLVLAKPVTYMNNSGVAVQSILHWYKLKQEDMLVIHDEVALPLGKIRYQHNGGAGGHHGIESIVAMLGGKADFCRLRLGVGPDPGGDRRADYVLSLLPTAQVELRDKIVGLCLESTKLWLQRGIQITANKYNGLDLRPPMPPEPPPQLPPASVL